MIYIKKTSLVILLILFSDKVVSQRINNLDFGLEGREVFLNFNLTHLLLSIFMKSIKI